MSRKSLGSYAGNSRADGRGIACVPRNLSKRLSRQELLVITEFCIRGVIHKEKIFFEKLVEMEFCFSDMSELLQFLHFPSLINLNKFFSKFFNKFFFSCESRPCCTPSTKQSFPSKSSAHICILYQIRCESYIRDEQYYVVDYV